MLKEKEKHMLESLRKDADIIIKNAIEAALPDSAVKKLWKSFLK